jgi:hypothetical protein
MAFTEKIKEEVKKKAHYQCCICKNPFVDVHHITPQSDGGSDDFDNAAPLCGACHRQYGNNPDLKKTIIGMRDLWYEICETRYKNDSSQFICKKIDDLRKEVIEEKEKDREKMDELKRLIISLQEIKSEEIRKSKSIEDLSGKNISATKLSSKVFANFVCKKCGTRVGLLIGSNECPTCGEPIE